MRRRKYKVLLCPFVLVVCVLYYFFSIGDYIYSRSFENEFDYPLNIDIKPVVKDILSGKKPDVKPINYYPYRFLTNSGKCKTIEKLDLFIVVKSAMKNFGHRDAVRQTYGQENVISGRIIKTLFFLGIDGRPKSETQRLIDEEMAKHKDIIQIDFHDNYYNNTIKTMMSFRWLYEHCSTADFYLFTDDDMYISVNNLIDYVNDQATNKIQIDKDSNLRSSANTEENGQLYAGYVFKSGPQRFKSSKWRVTLDEYPWNKWPPYVTAGAYVISNKSMKYLYVGSLFVKHFRFDDIYLGIVAKKVGIGVRHCPQFHFYRKKYSKDGYKDVIASHGFQDHAELVRVWNEQNIIV
ncbi:beta-1,3-galactosyltransferase brn [Amyelois transitella]|uniref:beta-1,3-galactosyltransferase brn n=1 Tax=Amyelois transitella TaxID=680683 RepID=UPI0029906ACC|nr:beta-1,3-galactosyltransferase brn [Amyelois transitella]XP_060802784.1 beta-1,3-galactosyltransferase brn [Amyelois transitella]